MRISKTIKFLFVALLVAGLLSAPMMAQEGRGKGRITGSLEDDKGNMLAGKELTLYFDKNPDLKHTTKTNSKGEWSFNGLGTGTWVLTTKVEGFEVYKSGFRVNQLSKNPYRKVKLKKPKLVPKMFFEEGNKLFAEKKYDEAIEKYKAFLEKHPDTVQAMINIAKCYNAKGDKAAAMKQFESILGKLKDTDKDKETKAQIYSTIGQFHLDKNETEKATEYFKKSVDLNPKDEILAYNVAEIFYSKNKTKEAIKYYKLAAQIKPSWGEIYTKIGYAYLNLGDTKSAIEYLKKFLEKAPNSPEAPGVKEVIKSLQ